MRKAVLYSTALHATVIAVAWFGVPSLFRPPPPMAPPIAVELVMERPPEKPALPRPVPTRQRSALETRQLEQILIRAVRQQLSPCWNIPAGAKDAEAMQVGIRIRLSPDGTLRGAPAILDPNRLASDPYYRAVAESAVRALLNPECRPLRLPLDQYDIWKEITFNFDPGEALGR